MAGRNMIGRPKAEHNLGYSAQHAEDFVFDRFIYTCGEARCARTIMVNVKNRKFREEWYDWLIGKELSDRPLYVRCPRHITDRALEDSQVGRTGATRKWAVQAERRDRERGPRPASEFITPYPHTGPFIEDIKDPKMRQQVSKLLGRADIGDQTGEDV